MHSDILYEDVLVLLNKHGDTRFKRCVLSRELLASVGWDAFHWLRSLGIIDDVVVTRAMKIHLDMMRAEQREEVTV